MKISKAWDWSRNTDNIWLVPCMEIPWLAERWAGRGYVNFLDLGCGLGRHSFYMARKGFSTSAVDLSEFAIEQLNHQAETENINIDTAIGDMLCLPYDNCSFDCIIAYNVIYHTNTKGFVQTLTEINRILKPGGEIFLTLISKNTYSYKNKDNYKTVDENTLLRDENETGEDIPHFYVDINDVKKLFSKWSFVLIPKEFHEYDMTNSNYYSSHWSLLIRKP